jgi:hypothetical protein
VPATFHQALRDVWFALESAQRSAARRCGNTLELRAQSSTRGACGGLSGAYALGQTIAHGGCGLVAMCVGFVRVRGFDERIATRFQAIARGGKLLRVRCSGVFGGPARVVCVSGRHDRRGALRSLRLNGSVSRRRCGGRCRLRRRGRFRARGRKRRRSLILLLAGLEKRQDQ